MPVPPRERADFVAISRFVVANGMEEAVRDAFLARPRVVDDAPGFRGFEVLRPADDPREFWLVTRWDDEPSFRAWHRSHAYKDAHTGIPRGLKLDPRGTSLRFFEPVAS